MLLVLLVLTACGTASDGSDGSPAGSDTGAPVTGISSSDDDGYAGILLDRPYVVPPVSLVDTDNRPFELAAQPHRTLVFFGYTNCPDICSTIMSTIASALTRLTAEQRADLHVAFVTTDPARDTRTALRTYLDRFDPTFTGVTGPLARIVALAKPLGIDILAGRKLAGGGYEVEHTTQVIAVRGARADLVWTAGTSPSDLADDLRRILKERA